VGWGGAGGFHALVLVVQDHVGTRHGMWLQAWCCWPCRVWHHSQPPESSAWARETWETVGCGRRLRPGACMLPVAIRPVQHDFPAAAVAAELPAAAPTCTLCPAASSTVCRSHRAHQRRRRCCHTPACAPASQRWSQTGASSSSHWAQRGSCCCRGAGHAACAGQLLLCGGTSRGLGQMYRTAWQHTPHGSGHVPQRNSGIPTQL
jgi:hypothetical protein